MANNNDLPTPEEIIESISEWPVDYNSSPVEKIINPSSVSSFFLRNVDKHRPSNDNKRNEAKEDRSKADPEVTVDVALARWWRRKGKQIVMETETVPDSHNPNTIINFAARTEAGTEFILNEIKRLRTQLEGGHRSDDVYSAISSCYEQILNYSLAKMYLETAVEKNAEEMEYVWRLKRLRRMIEIRRSQETMLTNLPSDVPPKRCMPEPKVVQRVPMSELSFREFFFNYALPGRPVIITGAVTRMTPQPWTLDHVADLAGECSVTLKRPVKESVKWAKLEETDTVKVGDFIRDLRTCGTSDETSKQQEQQQQQHQQLRYLFDWSLPTHCPKLAQELTIPKYFAGDFLQRTVADSYYRDSFPSLFIAPAGITSELHVDTFGSNFWMALFEGRKKWTFFDRADTPKLYPSYDSPSSSDPVFQVDLGNPDLQQFPLLSQTQPLQCVLEPGDLLFVPAGCPHRVENLETSLAISGNYVDLSNFDQVKQELAMAAIIHSRSKALLEQLSDPDFQTNMWGGQCDMKWEDFKSWPSSNYEDYDITGKEVKEHREKLNRDKSKDVKP